MSQVQLIPVILWPLPLNLPVNALTKSYAGAPEPEPVALPIGVHSMPVRSMSASRHTSPSAFSQRDVDAPALTLLTNSMKVPTSAIPLSSDGVSPPPPPITTGDCFTTMVVDTSYRLFFNMIRPSRGVLVLLSKYSATKLNSDVVNALVPTTLSHVALSAATDGSTSMLWETLMVNGVMSPPRLMTGSPIGVISSLFLI